MGSRARNGTEGLTQRNNEEQAGEDPSESIEGKVSGAGDMWARRWDRGECEPRGLSLGSRKTMKLWIEIEKRMHVHTATITDDSHT